MLLTLWDSVIVLCFVLRYFVSILVLQSSRWGRESWLRCFVCLPGSRDCCVALPHDAMGLSSNFLIILSYYFSQKILLFETLLYCLIILLFDHSIDVSHVLVSNLGTLGPSFFSTAYLAHNETFPVKVGKGGII